MEQRQKVKEEEERRKLRGEERRERGKTKHTNKNRTHAACSAQTVSMNRYDDAARTLRWDPFKGGTNAKLLRLLREHVGTLRQLHVA
jgi:hypothetical protein